MGISTRSLETLMVFGFQGSIARTKKILASRSGLGNNRIEPHRLKSLLGKQKSSCANRVIIF